MLSPFLAVRRRWYYVLPPEAYLLSLGLLIGRLPRRPLAVFDREMRRRAEAMCRFKTFNLASARSALELIAMVKAEVPRVRSPVLLVQSPRDSVVDPSGAAWVFEHIGSTVKELHMLKTSDHLIALDAEREEVIDRVAAFLEKSNAGAEGQS